MHDLSALLKREWLEHRTALILPPSIMLGLMVLALLVGVVFSSRITVDINFDEDTAGTPRSHNLLPQTRAKIYMVQSGAYTPSNSGFRAMNVAAPDAAHTAALMQIAENSSGEKFSIGPEDATDGILDGSGFDHLQSYLAVPFLIVMLFITFMLAINVTWDERKDRSILFWKSMPVSDAKAVLAKFAFLGWVTPWATVAAILMAHIVLAVVLDFYSDENLILRLLTDSGFYSNTSFLLLSVILLGFWLAPVYAWLMFIGAATPRSPLLAATFIPIILMVLEKILFDTDVIWSFIVQHLTPSPLPMTDDNWSKLPQFFANPGLWIGLAIAGGLLGTTIHFRRRCNEV